MNDKTIEKLRILCGGGKNTENDLWNSNVLSPIECCEIYIDSKFYNTVLNLPQKWIVLAKSLLPLIGDSGKCKDAFKKLLFCIFDSEQLEGKSEFLKFLWMHLEESPEPHCEILDDLVRNSPEYLEIKVINTFFGTLQDVDIWRKNNLVNWCSRSSVVFITVTSIMSEILQQVSETNPAVLPKLISSVKYFVNSVSQNCKLEDRDFVDLYPWRYRGLVCLFDCNLTEKVQEVEKGSRTELRSAMIEWILPVILKWLNVDPAGVFTLLTHYPTWLPYLQC